MARKTIERVDGCRKCTDCSNRSIMCGDCLNMNKFKRDLKAQGARGRA